MSNIRPRVAVLRHRYATRAYGRTRDLLAVQRLLGHTSPDTTQTYVELPMEDLVAVALSVG